MLKVADQNTYKAPARVQRGSRDGVMLGYTVTSTKLTVRIPSFTSPRFFWGTWFHITNLNVKTELKLLQILPVSKNTIESLDVRAALKMSPYRAKPCPWLYNSQQTLHKHEDLGSISSKRFSIILYYMAEALGHLIVEASLAPLAVVLISTFFV